jgi:hypothetical protein
VLEHQVGGHQSRPRREHASQHRGGDRERRVGHHAEGSSGQPQAPDVGAHDRHRRPGEALAQQRQATWVELDRDHPCARGHEMGGQRSGAGPDVEDEVAGRDASVSDDPLGPPVA